MKTKKKLLKAVVSPRILAVGINAPYNKTNNIDSYYEEFMQLIKTNNIECEATFFTKLRKVDASTFLTKGKLSEVLDVCKKHKIEEIIFSEPFSRQQDRKFPNFRDYTV